MCYFDSSVWKSMVNIVDKNDNSFPLYLVCNYRDIKTINLLIENGSVYSPYQLDINKTSSENLKNILKMMISNLKKFYFYKLKIDFKIFCNVSLDERETKFNSIYNNYFEIIKLLVEKFPNIVNQIDDDNKNICFYYLYFSLFDITKIIIKENFKCLAENLNLVCKKLKSDYEKLLTDNDYQILMKDFFRLKILEMFNYLKNIFNDFGLFKHENKILKYDEVVIKYFGTIEDYDSIFLRFHIKNSFDEDYKTGIITLKILSNFENIDLKYDKKNRFYELMFNKFDDRFNKFVFYYFDINNLIENSNF